MNQSVRKRVHVAFWRLFNPYSREFAINHRQSSNRFIALDKPFKKYIQEEQSKKVSDKNPMGREVSLLSEFLNRRKRQEKF